MQGIRPGLADLLQKLFSCAKLIAWSFMFIVCNYSTAQSASTESAKLQTMSLSNNATQRISATHNAAANEKLISLNFQDIKIATVLQLLAQFSGVNIIMSDAIRGNMSLHLENIPWRQALAIILETHGLGAKKLGPVIYIASIQEIADYQRQALQAAQRLQDLGALTVDFMPINYGKAQDIAALLKSQSNSLLSARGNVSVDNRTNTLWVQDVPARLLEIHKLVQRLDIPVRQVLIEARIVNINNDFAQELGVRFGLTRPNNMSGTLLGADSLKAGLMPTGAAPNALGASLTNRLNVDLPAPGSATGVGAASIGLALARLGSGTLLDLELSAMESEGEGQIVSSPQVITADQQTALIQAGDEIPYQESTSSGATSTQFKNAVLSLSVTPQIAPNGKVNLTLKVNQDRADYVNKVNGVPPITTRSIETQVLVNNGQTIVLGGIYETDNGAIIKRVPFLGRLPIIGVLFRNKIIQNQRRELLIFITPSIISDDE